MSMEKTLQTCFADDAALLNKKKLNKWRQNKKQNKTKTNKQTNKKQTNKQKTSDKSHTSKTPQKKKSMPGSEWSCFEKTTTKK